VLRSLPPPVTAARLAAETEVSQRSVYRDITALRAAGARIEGEAGLGYVLAEDPALPPQNLTRLEIEALLMGLAEVRNSGDSELAAAADAAGAKIIARLPDRQQREAMHSVLYLFRKDRRQVAQRDLGLLRLACWDEIAVDLSYAAMDGKTTTRRVLPLTIAYLDHALMLLAWCCLRNDYRKFRIDRIVSAALTDESFRPQRVPLLRDYVAAQHEAAASNRTAPRNQAMS
jgi:predicted DNA-binding transcriptional regulator YafY